MLTYEQGVAPFRNTTRLSAADKAMMWTRTLQQVCPW
jgi:L-fuconolactonase